MKESKFIEFYDAGDVEENKKSLFPNQNLLNALDKYQALTRRTAGEFDNKKMELVAWSMGIGGEAGEYVDGIKKHVFHGHALDEEAQAKELGDILFYVARSAEALGYPLSKVATMNIEKLEKRYPDGFSEERSKNRAE